MAKWYSLIRGCQKARLLNLSKKVKITRAGGKLQFELATAEKKYAELGRKAVGAPASALGVAHSDRQIQELALAKKIESLKENIKMIQRRNCLSVLNGSAGLHDDGDWLTPSGCMSARDSGRPRRRFD